MNLQLPLKNNWFDMTKSAIKTEDYREITPYWCSRLLLFDGIKMSRDFWYNTFINTEERIVSNFIMSNVFASFKPFNTNTMTLGYPKSTDTERILKLEHKGIEIREGNPEWGAEKGKLYFVIKHGNICKQNK